MIKDRLTEIEETPALYPFLRKLFGQEDGLNLATLLAIMPYEQLSATHLLLACATGKIQVREQASAGPSETLENAA